MLNVLSGELIENIFIICSYSEFFPVIFIFLEPNKDRKGNFRAMFI